MGYDVDRFIGKVNEGLLCCVCRDVLEDPQQAPCEHAFCRKCILGWLENEASCPEDRHPLRPRNLRPLFRYMKNDLLRLRIRCKNFRKGCEHISNLETVSKHEEVCPQQPVPCPNKGCTCTFSPAELEQHMLKCEFGSRECTKGCGLTVTTLDEREHNCIAELRSNIQLLRSEMICRLDDQKKEMELRLDMQRCHMVAREAALQANIDELKEDIGKINKKVKLLLELELKRRQDLEKMHTERRELLEVLRDIQAQHEDSQQTTTPNTCRHCSNGNKGGKVTTL